MVDSFNAQAATDMELDTSVYTSVNTFFMPYTTVYTEDVNNFLCIYKPCQVIARL